MFFVRFVKNHPLCFIVTMSVVIILCMISFVFDLLEAFSLDIIFTLIALCFGCVLLYVCLDMFITYIMKRRETHE